MFITIIPTIIVSVAFVSRFDAVVVVAFEFIVWVDIFPIGFAAASALGVAMQIFFLTFASSIVINF